MKTTLLAIAVQNIFNRSWSLKLVNVTAGIVSWNGLFQTVLPIVSQLLMNYAQPSYRHTDF